MPSSQDLLLHNIPQQFFIFILIQIINLKYSICLTKFSVIKLVLLDY